MNQSIMCSKDNIDYRSKTIWWSGLEWTSCGIEHIIGIIEYSFVRRNQFNNKIRNVMEKLKMCYGMNACGKYNKMLTKRKMIDALKQIQSLSWQTVKSIWKKNKKQLFSKNKYGLEEDNFKALFLNNPKYKNIFSFAYFRWQSNWQNVCQIGLLCNNCYSALMLCLSIIQYLSIQISNNDLEWTDKMKEKTNLVRIIKNWIQNVHVNDVRWYTSVIEIVYLLNTDEKSALQLINRIHSSALFKRFN